jgi:acyl-CoA synthetase (AMP-forming)/AMP-acid ligase II
MNAFDYLFEHTRNLPKDFILNEGHSISFSSLYNSSLKLALYLNKEIGQKNNVLLISPNSVSFVIAYLGIIKSGNIVIPLNPEIEQKNLDYICRLCDTKCAIIAHSLIHKIKLHEMLVITDNILNELLVQAESMNSTPNDCQSDDLAEIIFTSGSTGEPKGVMISHRNLISNTTSILQYLNLTAEDIMLVVLPFYYCYGLSLLHTHLRVGGSLVLNNMFIMLGSVINDLKKYNCTSFAGVPSHFQVLLRKSDSFKTTHFPDLKYVTQAGGKLHNTFIKEFIETFPTIKFYVMYGQTEATARLSYLPPEKLPEKMGSCGKGIPGVELRVVDNFGNQVKPGETGEILAKGENIMLGYYKDTQSTSETLKNGWLHTGDIATVDEEGYIYLTARKKEIIKVGGRRISPKEIEEVILSIPEVIDCNIEGVYDETLGETMRAIIIVKESELKRLSADNIKKYCAQKLAPYKIPQIIELKDKLIMTPTGKKIKI